jgi:hypothetical protein
MRHDYLDSPGVLAVVDEFEDDALYRLHYGATYTDRGEAFCQLLYVKQFREARFLPRNQG